MNKKYNYFVFSFWFFFATLVFFSSMKEQIVVNKEIKKHISTFFPEGWGFFTKNPRDLQLEVYKIKNNRVNKINMSNHSAFNYFGLSRKARVIGYESSIIANEVDKKKWKKDEVKNIVSFVNDSSVIIPKKKEFKYLVPGDYIFKMYKPIPYAWANKNQEDNNPYSLVKVKIE
jgi:antimicrobial peptide system SdpA family protein